MPDPKAPEDQSKGWVIATMTSGRRVETVIEGGLGSPANPMSEDEVKQKFRDNMKFAGLGANVGAAIDLVDSFDTLEDVAPLITLCSLPRAL